VGNCNTCTIALGNVGNTSHVANTYNSTHDYVSANINTKRRKHELKITQQSAINEPITF
jgi:hypothetical protein